MTEKLFYKDSYIKEFEACVVSCEQKEEIYEIVLDKTAFFPEGGGQYADTGYLGGVFVMDAQEKDGLIYHKAEAPLTVGSAVTGSIRWQERFEKMQQHSAEHIISGIVKHTFGYDNVGFHLSDEYCTLDFNGPITKEELKQLEYQSNDAVYKNIPIVISYPTKEVLREMDYRSKIEIEGQVRLVTIPQYDVCACCAPQVKQTGEIGLIKFINVANYKGGVRITIRCGFRALRDYDAKQEYMKALGVLLSEKEESVTEAVGRLQEDMAALNIRLLDTQKKLLTYKCEKIAIDTPLVCVFDSELMGSQPRECMNLLLERGAMVCAVFAGTQETGYRYVIGSKEKDVRPLSQLLNQAFGGRGGGKAEMVQGTLSGEKAKIKLTLSNFDLSLNQN